MHKTFRTLLLASLFCVPGSLFARTATPLVHPVQEKNVFAAWTPNQFRSTTTDVNVIIYLPSEGTHNWWDLEFVSLDTNQSTYFTTDSNTASTTMLGSLPEGRYNLYYNAIYGPYASFDVDAGCNHSSKRLNGNQGSVFGFTISEDCNIIAIEKY